MTTKNQFVLVLLIAGLVAPGCGGDDDESDTQPAPDGAATSKGSSSTTNQTAVPETEEQHRAEIELIRTMIDHSETAVQEASVCTAKAVHAELRTLCQDLGTRHDQKIDELQRWLEHWYGISHLPVVDNPDQLLIERLNALSGEDLDRSFLLQMISHHWVAITLCARALPTIYHRELERIVEQIITKDAAEIKQLQEFLCTWYKQCDYLGHGG